MQCSGPGWSYHWDIDYDEREDQLALADLLIFMRAIGQWHSSKIKALSIPLNAWPYGETYLETFAELLRQHNPHLL